MSLTGKITMGVLRIIKPGKGSFSDLEKLKKKARKENEGFSFSYPKNRKAAYSLLPGTPRECMIIDPVTGNNQDKCILYIYGGVTNNWKTQCSMAVDFAVRTRTEVWYPVYPAMSEVPVSVTIDHLIDIYRRMTERYDPSKIVITGVSMGGMFALEIINAINRKYQSIPMPGLIIAHSPGGWPVNEKDWEQFRRYEKKDPMFSEGDIRMTLKMVPGDMSLSEPYLFPELGDFRNAPPSYLFYGEEMIAGNAPLYERAFIKCGEAGKLHIKITENMMHAYSSMPVFPESRVSYNEIVRLIEDL